MSDSGKGRGPSTVLLCGLYATAWFAFAWFCLGGAPGGEFHTLLFAGALAAFHALAAAWLPNARGRWRAVLLALYAVVSMLVIACLSVRQLYVGSGGTIGADAIRAMAQTDVGELLGWLRRELGWRGLLFTVLPLAVFGLLFRAAMRRPARAPSPWIACGAMLACAGTAGAGLLANLDPLLAYLGEYRAELKAFEAVLRSRQLAPIEGVRADPTADIVVVIGESTSRHHMGIYGYFRPTTPRLTARADELVVFRDVISAHSHSVQAIISALTSAGSAGEPGYFTPGSIDIISLARGAGYRTHWLSNQNEFGLFDNPVTALARAADRRRFISTTLGEGTHRSRFDHELLPLIEEALQDEEHHHLVFVHTFGTHWPYCHNVPPEFRSFEGRLGARFFGNARDPGDVSCYDNGVSYVDSVLDRIMTLLARRARPAALLYFSDHGEAPLLGTGHDSSRHSAYHIEVPMLFWANEPFALGRPAIVDAARSNARRPYSTGRLYHSLAQLLDIGHESVRQEHSVFSDELADIGRQSLDGRIRYDTWSEANDYRENVRALLDRLGAQRGRVWAHRVNTLGGMMEAAAIFDGVEIDVVFMDAERCFHAFHPPAPDTGLTLEELLGATRLRPELKIWLDWKNAQAGNVRQALECLDRLDRQYGLRGRVLVETGSEALFDEVGAIARAGYRHGYYLPTERIRHCLNVCTPDEAGRLAESLKQSVQAHGFTAVTFDWSLIAFVDRWLGEWAESRGLELYSWNMHIDPSADPKADVALEKVFSRAPLAALLVTFPSVFRL